MMEEVGDDTNGESTFEFVGKGDEGTVKEDFLQGERKEPEAPINESILASFSAPPTTQSLPIFYPTAKVEPQIPISNNPSNQFSIPASNISPLPPPPSTPYQHAAPISAPSHYVSPPFMSQFPPSQQSPPPTGYPQFSQPLPQAAVQPQIFVPDCSVPLPHTEYIPPMVPESNETGVWGWIKGHQFLNRVAEKAKSSVDSVITTLDPGMKEIIYTGGDINVLVASENEAKVSAVREAFQLVFGKATVQGVGSQPSSIAPQPVGFSAGLKAAEERISNLRQQGFVQPDHILVAVENFITEITPENWFDIGCLLLQDFNSGITLQVYSQSTPVSSHFVQQAKDQTPVDFPLGWSGHAVTIGQVIGSALGVHNSEWHQALTGISRREMLFLAAKSLAGLYKAQIRH